VGADRLLHLDLLLATLLGVQLRAQTAVVLRLLGAIVALTRNALARALIVIEALAMPLDGLVHRKERYRRLRIALGVFVDVQLPMPFHTAGG
jgi:hypothetical protein